MSTILFTADGEKPIRKEKKTWSSADFGARGRRPLNTGSLSRGEPHGYLGEEQATFGEQEVQSFLCTNTAPTA